MFFLSSIQLPNLKFLFEIPLPFNNPMSGQPVLQVPAYGVMMMLGFLAAMLLIRKLARLDRLDREVIHNVWFISLISGVFGARLFYVIQNGIPEKSNFFVVFFKLWSGGLVWYGGLFGALFASLTYMWLKGAPMAKIMDAGAPPTVLGLAFGRIGCFLNGCCWGKIITPSADGPWYGVVYPRGAPAGEHYWNYFVGKAVNAGLAHPEKYGKLVTIHPAQIYACILVVLLCLALLWLRRTRKVYGEQILWLFIIYSPVRFLLECIRTETPKEYLGYFTPGQVIGLLIFIPAVAGLILLRRYGRPMAQTEAVLKRAELKSALATAVDRNRLGKKGGKKRRRR